MEVPSAVKKEFEEVIAEFSELMLRELCANYAKKGGRESWLKDNPRDLLKEVYYHTGKLQQALWNNHPWSMGEYAADIANMAMMVHDRCNRL